MLSILLPHKTFKADTRGSQSPGKVLGMLDQKGALALQIWKSLSGLGPTGTEAELTSSVYDEELTILASSFYYHVTDRHSFFHVHCFNGFTTELHGLVGGSCRDKCSLVKNELL